MMNRRIKIAIGAALLLNSASIAYAQLDTPDDLQPIAVEQQSGISFITGGIGEEERDQLQSARHDYNLHVLSSYSNGAYSGDVNITLYNAKGIALITSDAGPIFYAELPPGHYKLVAVNGEMQQNKSIVIGKNHATELHLIWR